MQEPRSFDAPGKLLARLVPASPRIAFAMADALGALRNRVTRRWPTAAEVSELFPHVDAITLASRIGALYERNRVLVHAILRYGIDPVRSLVFASDSLRSMRGPRILVTFHVGALHALGPALERLDVPVLAFRSGMLFTPGGALEVQSTEGNEQARAAALHRALVHLRGGGMVLLALDVAPGDAIETRCLGHPLPLAPGAFTLARWTGAPMHPIVARWEGHRVFVDAGDPIATPDDAAQWLERYLLARPSEVTLGLLRKLLGVS